MNINKYISYLLCNKGIIVNLYKLNFSSFHFSLQPSKRVFHPLTFPPLQPNIQEGKLNIFHPSPFLSSHNFPSSHFSTSPTKQSLNEKRAKCVRHIEEKRKETSKAIRPMRAEERDFG